LGSTLRDTTIESFFKRFPHHDPSTTNTPPAAASHDDGSWEITMDEAVLCLEDQLQKRTSPSTLSMAKPGVIADKLKSVGSNVKDMLTEGSMSDESSQNTTDHSTTTTTTSSTAISVPELSTPGEEGGMLDRDDLVEDSREEHVVEVRECPICHLPRLNKRSDADIITHIATCASQDWRQVNNLVMGGFVTASQAQRKWYSKVMTKIGYGGYKLGANSANILVQDRITGHINEEKMSVYVRLGIRLLYKGLKSKDMENKRSKLSFKGCVLLLTDY